MPRQPGGGDRGRDAVGEPLAERGMRANASSVSTSPSVARTAASERVAGERAADAADVLVVGPSCASARRASSAVTPNAPTGTPPPIALPIVSRSGSSPSAAVQPPGRR